MRTYKYLATSGGTNITMHRVGEGYYIAGAWKELRFIDEDKICR